MGEEVTNKPEESKVTEQQVIDILLNPYRSSDIQWGEIFQCQIALLGHYDIIKGFVPTESLSPEEESLLLQKNNIMVKYDEIPNPRCILITRTLGIISASARAFWGLSTYKKVIVKITKNADESNVNFTMKRINTKQRRPIDR